MATRHFLLDTAHAPGAFEKLQRQFDTAVVELAGHLAEPVERAMRAAIAQDLAAVLPEEAAAVERFLRGAEGPASASDAHAMRAEMARLHDELASLGPALAFDPQTVADEVQACAGELAHHMLALWFSTLRRALVPGVATPLNANMLPGEMTMHEVLDALDVAAFGVKVETVILASSRYRSALRARALSSAAPIVFADDLVVGVGRDDAQRPYTLHASEIDFRLAAAEQAARVARRPPAEAVRQQMVSVAQRIDMALRARTAPLARYQRLVDAALGEADGGWVQPGAAGIVADAAHLPVADELLAYPIEAVADAVAAGGSGEVVARRVTERLAEVAPRLTGYCEVRRMPFETVSTAYAVLVAARAQPMAVDVQIWESHGGAMAAHGSVQEQFAQALGMSVVQSATLISDAGGTVAGDAAGQGAASFTDP